MRRALLLLALFSTADMSLAADWPRFRGPEGTGISNAKNVPTTWDARSNIRWKIPMPGPGSSSPILFRDRIYLTCYSGYGLSENDRGDQRNLKRHLLCLNRADGRVIWDKSILSKVSETPFGSFLALHGYASSTPAADADAIYVYYGASGLLAYSHDGNVKWEKSCGTEKYDAWGSASSPILYKNLVIIHADVESGSIFAFDRKTGNQIWTRSFKSTEQNNQRARSTPLILNRPGRDELIIHSRMKMLSALDPASGNTLWERGNPITYQHPSPVTDGRMIYALGSNQALAIDPASSNITWQLPRGSETVTPIYHNGHLYWANEEGLAFCINTATGKQVYAERLEPKSGRIYASGVLADGRIYYVSREKGAYVVEAAPQYRLIAHNTIDDDSTVFNATPALDDGRIYLRSNKFLYCIGSK